MSRTPGRHAARAEGPQPFAVGALFVLEDLPGRFTSEWQRAQVTILNDADGRTFVDTTVDEHGNWLQQSPYTLTKGTYEATATQLFEGVPTPAPVRFTYGTPAPVTPVSVSAPVAGSTVSTDVVTFSGAGQPGAKVVVSGTGVC